MNLQTILTVVMLAAFSFMCVELSSLAAREWTISAQKDPADQGFLGKVEAVDTTANTLTVGGKIISVTSETKITKGGTSINLSDIKVGDEVTGMTRQGFNGKVEAVMIKVEGKNARLVWREKAPAPAWMI